MCLRTWNGQCPILLWITYSDLRKPEQIHHSWKWNAQETSQVRQLELYFNFLKVIDLEEMITAKELMDLHRLERSILGRQGF